MSHSNALPHIIAYDIADPKRLNRVNRLIKQYAIPLQYSVFLGHLNSREKKKLEDSLQDLIHPREDDVRLYPLPLNPEWNLYGVEHWDDELQLTGVELPTTASVY